MTRVRQFTCEAGVGHDDVGRVLSSCADAEPHDLGVVQRVCLDTFDRRLGRSGLVLLADRTDDTWSVILRSADGAREHAADQCPAVPGRPGDVADPRLRRLLAAAIGPRRLLPWLDCRIRRATWACVDERRKSVATIALERVEDDAPDAPAPMLVCLTARRGYEAEARALARTLREHLPARPIEREGMLEFGAALGVQRPDYTPKPAVSIVAETPIACALADALQAYLDVMRANEHGVLDDLDPEFLHDFRVAARRSRSLASAFRGVLGERAARAMLAEFKWMSQRTGPLRDLDVLLIDVESAVKRGAAEPDEVLAAFVRKQRLAELRKVRRMLQSKRYERFVRRTSELLAALPAKADGTAALPAANAAIARRHHRIVRRIRKGRAWRSESSLHALRKDCKKLRYLLEAFADLYPPRRHAKAVRKLKTLQDALGQWCDAQVRATLVEQWRAAADRGEIAAELAERLARLPGTASQTAVPKRLRSTCRRFASGKAAKRFEQLLSGKQ